MSSDQPFLLIGSISALLKDDDIVLSVLSNDGAYGFLLDVIRKSTGEILHALKITLFFEGRTAQRVVEGRLKQVADDAQQSQMTQAKSTGDPQEPGYVGHILVYKKMSPESRRWEEIIFTILNQVFSNGCKLHGFQMCEREEAIELMTRCEEAIIRSGMVPARKQYNSDYIKCIIQFLNKIHYTNITMCLLLLERLYVNPSIPITHEIRKILQIQIAANVLNLLLNGFVGTDLNTNNIVYAEKEELSDVRKTELIAIQARALQLAPPGNCKLILEQARYSVVTAVSIDSGALDSCKTHFSTFLEGEGFSKYKKKKKRKASAAIFEKDMNVVESILREEHIEESALNPRVLGYLLEILHINNVRMNWLENFPFVDKNTLIVIECLIQAANEYRKRRERIERIESVQPLVPLLQVPGRELKTIADYKQYAKMLIDEEVPSGGGKVTQSVKSSYIDNLYKFTPLKNQSAPEGRIDSSTKLPVTDLNRAPQRGADSNLHRYKKTKKRKLKNKKNVKNKSYKVRRT